MKTPISGRSFGLFHAAPTPEARIDQRKNIAFRISFLNLQVFFWYHLPMRVSTIVNEKVWRDLKKIARETNKSLTGMVEDALRDYVQKNKVRPLFLEHMRDSLGENEETGRLLASG